MWLVYERVIKRKLAEYKTQQILLQAETYYGTGATSAENHSVCFERYSERGDYYVFICIKCRRYGLLVENGMIMILKPRRWRDRE